MKLHRTNHVVVGVVFGLDDPLRLGRILVRFPLLEDWVSFWARLVVPMAGREQGTFFRPQIGDEVLVTFEQGEPRRPYILGSLWSQVDPPPPAAAANIDNYIRVIVSASGHVVRFDDTPGAPKIELITGDGERRVVLEGAGQKIRVECDRGDVEVKAGNGRVNIEAANVEIKATSNLSLEAGGRVDIKGAVVNIN